MGENEITVADLLQQLRIWLNAQGEAGSWLLAAIDDAVDTAFEFDVALVEATVDDADSVQAEATTDDIDLFGARVRTHGQRQRRTPAGRTTKVTGIAFRPPTDPSES